MSDDPKARRPIRWVVPAGILFAIAAAFYALTGRTGRPGATGEPPVEAPVTAEIEDPVARALRLAGVDSTRKSEWVDDVPGAPVKRLTPEQRVRFVRLANAQRCTCGCGFTLAACRAFDPTCEDSAPRIVELADSVAAGHYASVSGLRERPEPPR